MTDKLTALIGSIQKFSTEDGPGVRSTVFLKGCPLNCAWCHNPELINPTPQMIVSPNKCIGCMACTKVCPHSGIVIGSNGPEIDRTTCVACGKCSEECYSNAIKPVATVMTVDEVFQKVLQDKSFYDNTGGGITISGGEVLMHHDFAKALVEKCAEENIRVCIDTSGFSPYEVLEGFAKCPNVEYVLYDIKHINNDEHLKYTGVENTLIIDNLRKLAKDSEIAGKLWMRMPLMAGINDTDDIITQTAELYQELGIGKVSLVGYHDFGNSKAGHVGKKMELFSSPSEGRLGEIKLKFESIGMAVEITGREETIA
ncbi:MAG: glycyl-radical enzyme activating protein [Bacillota bacterium]|nr:glycyl-radical enzyme activating protein [Bacillota bacterium]